MMKTMMMMIMLEDLGAQLLRKYSRTLIIELGPWIAGEGEGGGGGGGGATVSPMRSSQVDALFPFMDTWVSQVSGVGSLILFPARSSSHVAGNRDW